MVVKMKHIKRIERIQEITKGLSPQEFRYVVKRVREEGKFALPKRKRKLPVYLTGAELFYARKIAMQHYPDDVLLFDFLWQTGLRIAECSNFMKQDIDYYNNVIKVVDGKGGKDRFVPIGMDLSIRLKEYTKLKKGFVFSHNGKKYTTRALRYRIDKIFKRCGFDKPVHVHTLRHTFATILRSKGVALEEIQKYMGHSSYQTTEIYAHMVQDEASRRKIMGIMDGEN
jgi:integrase/recombinase XerD